MAWTQADLDKLNTAIANGSIMQSISFADQTFTFRSLEEMLRLRAAMVTEVNAGKSARRLAVTSKGV